MRLDSFDADIENSGRLFVAVALGDQLDHNLLAVSQDVLDLVRLGQEVFEQDLRRPVSEVGLVVGQRLDPEIKCSPASDFCT